MDPGWTQFWIFKRKYSAIFTHLQRFLKIHCNKMFNVIIISLFWSCRYTCPLNKGISNHKGVWYHTVLKYFYNHILKSHISIQQITDGSYISQTNSSLKTSCYIADWKGALQINQQRGCEWVSVFSLFWADGKQNVLPTIAYFNKFSNPLVTFLKTAIH